MSYLPSESSPEQPGEDRRGSSSEFSSIESSSPELLSDSSLATPTSCDSRQADEGEPTFLSERAFEQFSAGIPAEWPQRLLHVPSMTVYMRREGNWYGPRHEPAFNALSYKWGHQTNWASEKIQFTNVPWVYPSVNQWYFTITEFENVLQRIAEGVDYVWLDIACVDQSPTQVEKRKVEIRREAAIYKQAKSVYVWLLSNNIGQDLERISESLPSLNSGLRLARNDGEIISAGLKTSDALSSLLLNPWFSSIWTMRENLLRRDSILLDRRGQPFQVGALPTEVATLGLLTSACTAVMQLITRLKGHQPGKDEMQRHINASEPFCMFSTRPDLLYQTTNELFDLEWGKTLGRSHIKPREIYQHTVNASYSFLDSIYNFEFDISCPVN